MEQSEVTQPLEEQAYETFRYSRGSRGPLNFF